MRKGELAETFIPGFSEKGASGGIHLDMADHLRLG